MIPQGAQQEAREQFRKALEHTIVAYRYFYEAIPTSQQFAAGGHVIVGDFEFEREAQAVSMRVELG